MTSAGIKKLIGLWDMLKLAAQEFTLTAFAVQARVDTLAARIREGQEIDVIDREHIELTLKEMRLLAFQLGLSHTVELLDSALVDNRSTSRTACEIKRALEILMDSLAREMNRQTLLHIPPEKATYYGGYAGFDRDTIESFPRTVDDIKSASNCFATDNDTACVFHLMRVLEKGLHSFATYLEIQTPTDLQNWKPIIDQIEKAIRALDDLPKSTEKSERVKFCSGAAIQFRYFKDAWRNHVVHSREYYDSDSVRSIMTHVQEFMKTLSAYGLREP